MPNAVPIAALAALTLLVTACAGPSQPTETETAPSGPSVVAIGDSIPNNSPNDCPGCTGFLESYAAALSEQSGEVYTAVNRSRHDGAGTAQIVDELESGSLDDVISAADIVIVSIGLNDQPPYLEADAPCSIIVNSDQEAIDGVIATTPQCVEEQTAVLRARLAEILSSVRELGPDADILALVEYNSWTGWSTLEAAGPETSDAVTDVIVSAIELWRDAVCEEAAAVDGQCVDLYEAFNGPDGRTPAGGLLANDYSHPSQEGNDLIRDLLLGARGA